MWEPVGPLAASVYRRRRWLAGAAVLVAVVLLAWPVVAFVAPGGDGTTAGAAASRAAHSAPQQASPPSTAATAVPPPGVDGAPPVGSPSAGPPGTTAVAPADGATPGTSSAVPAPSTTPGALAPTSAAGLDGTPSAPAPPPGPVPCTNEMLGVTAEVEQPEHRVGQRVQLRLVVTNTGEQPCVRDLDSARQEIVVWSGDGAARLWSSNDCSNRSRVDERTLEPDRPVAFSVQWTGRTSTLGCAEQRTVVPPGAYRLTTRLDDVTSAPTPFLRNP